jgi:hypothetical protein
MAQSNLVIVVMAFAKLDNGELVPAFDAVRFNDEERALSSARNLRNHQI